MKIQMAVDACGLLIHFWVTVGEIRACKKAPRLVASLSLG
jgi:hypothetical protein